MRNRFVRLCVVVVLLAAAGLATYVARGHFQSLLLAAGELDTRVDQQIALIPALVAAEAAYVAPGRNPPPLDAVPTLLRDVTTGTVAISGMLVSPQAATELQAFADATSRLAEADAAAREQLLVGDVRTAADIIHGPAAAAAHEMTLSIARVRSAERMAQQAAREQETRRVLVVLSSAGGVWVLGLLLLAFVRTDAAPREHAVNDTNGATVIAASAATSDAPDLSAVADLCTDIGRVETASDLNALLSRAQAILNAAGIIVWIESGGELFAAAAAGYPRETLARLPPIRRQDEHAAAMAWREGRTEVFAAGGDERAAIAVPLFSGAGCRGVFTVELSAGRDQDATTRDVARMIAAQLSVVVGTVATDSNPAALATGS